MHEDRLSYWERIEHKRRNVRRGVLATLFTTGVLTGLLIGRSEGLENLFGPNPVLSPLAAISLALLFLGAIALENWLHTSHGDEVERLIRYKGIVVGGAALMIVYPVWFVLWKGGIAPEPLHTALFALLVTASLGGTIYFRLR